MASSSNAGSIVERTYNTTVQYKPGKFQCGKMGDVYFSASSPALKERQNQRIMCLKDKHLHEFQEEKILKKVVSGQDGRQKIEKTSEYPYSIHVQLEMEFPNAAYGGSGSLVGPHHVLTCGHNIYDVKTGKWATKITVHPGRNGKSAPYGEATVTKAYTFDNYTSGKERTYDIAVLLLDRSVGKYTGWGGLCSAPDDSLRGATFNITGYPGDKGFDQMWSMSHKVKNVGKETFDYEIDTFGGQSGSAIWVKDMFGSVKIMGVHTLGGFDKNSGVRISKDKFIKLFQTTIANTYKIEKNQQISLSSSSPSSRQNSSNTLNNQFSNLSIGSSSSNSPKLSEQRYNQSNDNPHIHQANQNYPNASYGRGFNPQGGYAQHNYTAPVNSQTGTYGGMHTDNQYLNNSPTHYYNPHIHQANQNYPNASYGRGFNPQGGYAQHNYTPPVNSQTGIYGGIHTDNQYLNNSPTHYYNSHVNQPHYHQNHHLHASSNIHSTSSSSSLNSNHSLNINPTQTAQPSPLPSIALGKAVWEKHFKSVEGVQGPLPSNIEEILEGPTPFKVEGYSGNKVRDTHILVWIPEKVDGFPISLNGLKNLFNRYRYYNSSKMESAFGSLKLKKATWILSSKNVLVGSQDKTYDQQKKFLSTHAPETYSLPKGLELIAALLIYEKEMKKRVMTSYRLAYTRCQDGMCVGGFSGDGLCVSERSQVRVRNVGIACVQRFTDNQYLNNSPTHYYNPQFNQQHYQQNHHLHASSNIHSTSSSSSLNSNHSLNINPIQTTQSSPLPSIALGKSVWQKHFKSVEGVQGPLPSNIKEILDAPTPFKVEGYSGKVSDTHILVWIPEKVDGVAVSLDRLNTLFKYREYFEHVKKELGSQKLGKATWVLISKNVLEGSRKKTYNEQRQLMSAYASKGYTLPKALELTAALLIHEKENKEELLTGYHPSTYTLCQDSLNNNKWPVVIGGFDYNGLDVRNEWTDHQAVQFRGVVGARKFDA
ncbi:trypsin-like serine peptidase [Candidatus Neptunochlamydia vexilliferae]|uniref:Serine protease n=1 Tax=Candidatus Neptunichlamydia vexilliferae TaxID=1651774 RepID=A0ABS0B0E1_9BACT|nr:trypsin-like serine protease [Candidatus Neptunochlamydia vexilliferae]MBF5059854.1 hypothetical protein [Candidatus Neptunochlamydia vexilliferae]